MSTKKKPAKEFLFSLSLGIGRVVCVDQSYTHAGFSVWNVEDGTLLNFQQFSYHKKASNREKRYLQATTVQGLVTMFGCNAVVVEEPRMFPSAYTKARLHEIIATISDRVNVPVYMANTTAWKANTVGHRATKEQTVAYVGDRFHVVVDDDVADAICIGESVVKGMKLTLFD